MPSLTQQPRGLVSRSKGFKDSLQVISDLRISGDGTFFRSLLAECPDAVGNGLDLSRDEDDFAHAVAFARTGEALESWFVRSSRGNSVAELPGRGGKE